MGNESAVSMYKFAFVLNMNMSIFLLLVHIQQNITSNNICIVLSISNYYRNNFYIFLFLKLEYHYIIF